MTGPETGALKMSHFVLRSADMQANRRVAEFEAACAHVCQLQIEPGEGEFSSRTSIALAGGLVLADTAHSECVTRRTMALAAGTGDNLLLHIPLTGGFTIRQRGGAEHELRPGSLYLDPSEVPGVAHFHGAETHGFYLSIPRALVGASGGLTLRDQVALTPQWRLLLAYARGIHAEAAALSPGDLELCASHMQDLVLLAIGADRDSEAIARGRGARVARLRAIRADIERNLTSPELSAEWMAARHGISPRYLRSLFADEGTSFSDHVALRRLMRVRRKLNDPASAGMPISRIALDAGFGDISAFNQRFRQAFAMTPSEMRALAVERWRQHPGSA